MFSIEGGVKATAWLLKYAARRHPRAIENLDIFSSIIFHSNLNQSCSESRENYRVFFRGKRKLMIQLLVLTTSGALAL